MYDVDLAVGSPQVKNDIFLLFNDVFTIPLNPGSEHFGEECGAHRYKTISS